MNSPPIVYPAETLAAAMRAVDAKPLVTREQIERLYRPEINAIRGADIVQRMRIELEDAFLAAPFYKAAVMGHSGVGKSTEMSRLLLEVEGKFQAIRFSAVTDLDPGNLEPYDLVALIIMQLIEHAARPQSRGGLDFRAPEPLLEPLLDWLGEENVRTEQMREASAEASAGIGVPADTFLAKVLGVFASAKGELRYAASRTKERVEYRLRRLSELIDLANQILAAYREELRRTSNRDWLFLAEDFDKPAINPSVVEKLFIHYGSVLQELDCHLILSIPVPLVYSQKAELLPFRRNRILNLPDTPVFDRQHRPHEAGRQAIQKVLSSRVDPALLAPDQSERLVVASGGNLRELFSLVHQAALNARIRQAEKIEAQDVDLVISEARTTYARRLGESPYDPEKVTYQVKAARLVEIYHGLPAADMPDPVLHSLLLARAVQEFNGERWFGVHPLIAENLIRQALLEPETPKARRVKKAV